MCGNSIEITKAFFNNVPGDSYISIYKPVSGQRMWHVTIKTSDMKAVRATSCNLNLQECFDELCHSDMSLVRSTKNKEVDDESINKLLREIWAQVNG